MPVYGECTCPSCTAERERERIRKLGPTDRGQFLVKLDGYAVGDKVKFLNAAGYGWTTPHGECFGIVRELRGETSVRVNIYKNDGGNVSSFGGDGNLWRFDVEDIAPYREW
jgi:hypothetical protein